LPVEENKFSVKANNSPGEENPCLSGPIRLGIALALLVAEYGLL
jgi:hypothetical protein